MKISKSLVILVFLITLPLAWYKMIDDSKSLENDYNNAVATAREYSEMGIVVTAEQFYNYALTLYDNYDLRIEELQMYLDNGHKRTFEDTCKKLIDNEPEQVKAYEMLATYYKDNGIYKGVYQVYDQLTHYKKTSEVINKLCDELQYEYTYAISCAYMNATSFYNGCAVVEGKDGRKGHVNTYGSPVTACVYDYVSSFSSDGYAGVTDGKGDSYFINKSGSKIATDKQKRKIQKIGYYANGYCPVKFENKYYISDMQFNFSEKSYIYIGAYDGSCAPAYDGNKWFFIDKDGNKISDNTYDDILIDTRGKAYMLDTVAFVMNSDGKYIMIGKDEKQIGKATFDNVQIRETDTKIPVRVNGLWGYINTNGEMAIEPKYNEARSFSNGLAAVNIEGEWCFINENGDVVIRGPFTDANEFTANGTCFVCVEGRWKLLQLIKYIHN